MKFKSKKIKNNNRMSRKVSKKVKYHNNNQLIVNNLKKNLNNQLQKEWQN